LPIKGNMRKGRIVKKLGHRGRRWLFTCHVFFTSVWLGVAISMNLIMLLNGNPPTGEKTYVLNLSIKSLDDFLILPSVIGTVMTGLLISLMTEWRFFKYHWVTVKWIATFALLISGTFWLLPWLNSLIAISHVHPLIDRGSHYTYYRVMFIIMGNFQSIILTLMVLISVFKPGGRFKKE